MWLPAQLEEKIGKLSKLFTTHPSTLEASASKSAALTLTLMPPLENARIATSIVRPAQTTAELLV